MSTVRHRRANILYYDSVVTSVVRAISAFPRFVWDVAKIWYNGGIGDLAAGVTFWILITVPAAVLALVSSASFLGGIVGASLETEIKFEVLQFVNEVFTSDAPSIQDTVNELFDQQNTGVFTIAAALTLYTISRGFAGMIRALDTVYDVEDGRTWYHTRFVGLILGLGTVFVVVPIVLLEVFLWSEYELPREAALRALASTTLLVGWAEHAVPLRSVDPDEMALGSARRNGGSGVLVGVERRVRTLRGRGQPAVVTAAMCSGSSVVSCWR